MTYEFDRKPPMGSLPPQRRGLGDGMVRGRWKNACEDMPPGVVCYGFVFEEDPDGPHTGRPERPRGVAPGALDIQVSFTDEFDLILPAQIAVASDQQLKKMREEFLWNESRAGGDWWIGPPEEWRRRCQLVEQEMTKRGMIF